MTTVKNSLASLEKAFNSLLRVAAVGLEHAIDTNDWREVERIIKLLKKGL